jgi:ferric-dicitrate binding protein FerR (iron transport regulator)
METDQTYFEDLMVRYFSGELDQEGMQILSEWVASSPENKKLFEDYAKTWQLIEQESIERSVDVDKEWRKFITPLQERTIADVESDFTNKAPIRNMKYVRYARIAAVFILLTLSSIWLYTYFNKPGEKVLMASNQTVEATLPDGSHVTLNNGSTIKYPSEFAKDKRKISLQGEAYFDVAHDAAHPFIINSGNVCIEVLGTSFYVNTNGPGGNVEVVLTTGKVAVYYADKPEQKVILAPGERIEFPKANADFTKTVNTDENYMAWKTKKLVFSDQPLSNIVDQLNKVYHANISVSEPNLGDCRMTATFDHQELDAVLKVVEATLDVDIHKKGNTFVISGQGCK